MSVVAQQPYTGPNNKRAFEADEDAQLQGGEPFANNTSGPPKRARLLHSPGGRCRLAHAWHSPLPGPAGCGGAPGHGEALNYLRSLFPRMSDEAVESVLSECGQDIDAAIRRLTQLKLSTAEAQAHAQQQHANPAAPAAAPGSQAGTPRQDTAPQGDAGQAAAAAAAARGAGDEAAAADAALPQTAEAWVDALVQEMAAARDFSDARQRAAKTLQAFEAFVSARHKQSGDGGSSGGGSAGSGGGRLDEALRENAILKRAVQVQAGRLSEAAAACGAKDAELAGLRQLATQYQERLKQVELSNYSLALHLQKATGQDFSAAAGRQPPDVF